MANLATRCIELGKKLALPFTEPLVPVLKKALKNRDHRYFCGSTLSFLAITPPAVILHESLHMAGEYISRGIVGKLHVGALYGGALLHEQFPRYFGTKALDLSPLEQTLVRSGMYEPGVGAQEVLTQTEIVKTASSEVVIGAFPYMLTPLGILLLRKGLATKSGLLTGAGAMLAFEPAGNFFNDMALVGYFALQSINDSLSMLAPGLGSEGERFLKAIDTPTALGVVALITVGLATMNIVYHSSRSVADMIEERMKKGK